MTPVNHAAGSGPGSGPHGEGSRPSRALETLDPEMLHGPSRPHAGLTKLLAGTAFCHGRRGQGGASKFRWTTLHRTALLCKRAQCYYSWACTQAVVRAQDVAVQVHLQLLVRTLRCRHSVHGWKQLRVAERRLEVARNVAALPVNDHELVSSSVVHHAVHGARPVELVYANTMPVSQVPNTPLCQRRVTASFPVFLLSCAAVMKSQQPN
jgi:hypothetical protein